jgi:O-antigen/teichoic acid export membrane protein
VDEQGSSGTPTPTGGADARGAAAPAAAMGDRAARGFVWLMGQTLILRVVTLLGQLVLAYYLLEDEFGDVGLAMTVLAFAAILQQGGIGEVLVKRQAHLSRWSNPAFWMSLVLGIASGLLVAAAAPVAAWAYEDPDVVPLLYVLAISMVPAALIMVPEAKLNAELRFRTLAKVGVISATSQMALSVAFAASGFGAMSMVLPRPIVLTVHWVAVMLLAKPRVMWKPQARRWKYLISDNVTLVLGKLCIIVTHQGDYIVLGVLTTDKVVGLYYFAFGLSMQTMSLVTQSLGNVLFPVLSKLEDPKRQTQGFINAARLLALVGVPMCLLQAGVADPVIRELFKPRWFDAIPILQILSLGMALRLVGSPAGSLFYAQGRFRTVLVLNACYAVAFLIAVTIGALLADGIGVAVGASIYFAILGPVHMYVAIAPAGGSWRDVWNVYAVPVAASAAALAPSMWLADQVPPMAGRNWARMAVVTGGTGLLYLTLVRAFAPVLLEELFQRFRSMPVVGPLSNRVAAVLLAGRARPAVNAK